MSLNLRLCPVRKILDMCAASEHQNKDPKRLKVWAFLRLLLGKDFSIISILRMTPPINY